MDDVLGTVLHLSSLIMILVFYYYEINVFFQFAGCLVVLFALQCTGSIIIFTCKDDFKLAVYQELEDLIVEYPDNGSTWDKLQTDVYQITLSKLHYTCNFFSTNVAALTNTETGSS